MKIRLGSLRRLIVEAYLNEMPLMNVQPMSVDTKHPQAERGDTERKQRSMQRYFAQQQFVDKAIKLYRNLSVPIYIVPVWSGASNYVAGPERSSIIENDCTGTLVQLGVSPERAKALENARRGGAAIFISKASSLLRGALPSPWMIVHAMLDAGIDGSTNFMSSSSEMKQCFKQIKRNAFFELGIDPELWESDQPDEAKEKFSTLVGALTMASARDGHLGLENINDCLIEIMCQAILTSKGFVFNKTDDDDVNRALEKILSAVSSLRSAFEAAVEGKLIDTEVFLRG